MVSSLTWQEPGRILPDNLSKSLRNETSFELVKTVIDIALSFESLVHSRMFQRWELCEFPCSLLYLCVHLHIHIFFQLVFI